MNRISYETRNWILVGIFILNHAHAFCLLLVITLSLCGNSISGVYKGLQHSTSSATMLTSPSPVTMTPASLPASNSTNSTTTSIHNTHNPLSNHGNSTANAICSNLRLSVATPPIASINPRHLPRSLSGVPPAALKLAAAASNCQLPKVTTG